MTTSSIHDSAAELWLEIVRQRVNGMRFGSVQIVIHEGRVTQVESTEKTRLPDLQSNNATNTVLKKRSIASC